MEINFVPFGVDPDDPRLQAMREGISTAHAHAEDFANRVWDMFDRMSPEDLFTLLQLHEHYQNSGSVAPIAFTMGQVSTILKRTHNVCSGCGKDHTQEFFGGEPEPVVLPATTGDQTTAFDNVQPGRDPEFMQKYRVIDNGTGDRRVKCRDCGLVYPSLTDRMMKEPDNCHGCQLRSGHG